MIFTTLTVALALVAATSASPVNGTVGDGCTVTEYSQVAAAVASCTTLIIDGITVPARTTLTLRLLDGAHLTFQGRIRFGVAAWDGPLFFIGGTGISVEQVSGSYFDGDGHSYWDGKGGQGSQKPLFGYLGNVYGGSTFKNFYLRNCPERCVGISDSDSLTLTGWIIDNRAGDAGTAPAGKESYNTDGFDIARVTNIVIDTANVYNQDDCVAISEGSNMRFNNLYCHGSHGLSIAGGIDTTDGTHNRVSDIVFSNSSVVDGMNGIHIKTLPEGATGGYIKNVVYENIKISGMSAYGIIINQNYLGGGANGNAPTVSGNVPVTNLQLKNVQGSVNGQFATAVYILCGDGGCADWTWSDVSISPNLIANSCNFIPSGYNGC